jgi:Transmembrane exosortase (Exosortase_EpsH).
MKSIIIFVVLLFSFHFSWKLCIDGDMAGDQMYLFGKDVTPAWFTTVVRWLTLAIAWFVRLFPNTDSLVVGNNILYFPDGGIKIGIVWGCTGLKQLFIFCGIMILYRCISIRRNLQPAGKPKYRVRFNPYWDKLWYIPLGCIVLSIYNVMRIGFVVLLTRGHADRFEGLHDGLFRYIYYGIIFLLWVIWEEVYAKNKYHYYEDKQ